jgi:hypothetical protein
MPVTAKMLTFVGGVSSTVFGPFNPGDMLDYVQAFPNRDVDYDDLQVTVSICSNAQGQRDDVLIDSIRVFVQLGGPLSLQFRAWHRFRTHQRFIFVELVALNGAGDKTTGVTVSVRPGPAPERKKGDDRVRVVA